MEFKTQGTWVKFFIYLTFYSVLEEDTFSLMNREKQSRAFTIKGQTDIICLITKIIFIKFLFDQVLINISWYTQISDWKNYSLIEKQELPFGGRKKIMSRMNLAAAVDGTGEEANNLNGDFNDWFPFSKSTLIRLYPTNI